MRIGGKYGELKYGGVPRGLGLAPTVTSQAATDVTDVLATLNGNITDDGGGSITQHGFCWKIGSDPVNIAGSTWYSQLGAGTEGAFDEDRTGLTESATYYYRAYATNSTGTSYGSAVSFVTSTIPPSLGMSLEAR
jgi:hypothetical protein